MPDNWIDQIIEAIKPLADKLGEGAEALWHLSVREAIVTASLDLFWGLFFLALAITSVVMGRRLYRNSQTDDGEFTGILIAVLGGFMFGLISVLTIDNAIHGLFNPHWKAVEIIINQVQAL